MTGSNICLNQTNIFHFQSVKEMLYFLGPTNFLSFVIFDGKIVFVAASKQTTT